MEFEDYFKRQIDEIGKMLAALLGRLTGLKMEGQFGQGLDLVKQTLDEESVLNYNELASVPPDKLIDHLNKKNIRHENYEKLAELFFEMAEGLENTDRQAAMDFYEKSLKIHIFLNQSGSVYSFERHYKIDEIKEILDHYKL